MKEGRGVAGRWVGGGGLVMAVGATLRKMRGPGCGTGGMGVGASCVRHGAFGLGLLRLLFAANLQNKERAGFRG